MEEPAPSGEEVEARVDGRTARAIRTREAVVVALLGLLEEGQVQPSFEEISARAGVSERSIFGHFHDREGLFAAVADHQLGRLREEWGQLPGLDTPLAERLDAFVDQRARIYEIMRPVRRGALLIEPSSDAIRERLVAVRTLKRHEAWHLFSPELGDDQDRRAALAVLASFTGWDTLRTQQGLSVEDATAALRAGVSALLRP
jgi:TetR/AcrR family transcriptional regulator of autoinduction and epiphytic fitness